jgi:aryl-phospho-beta-D-glucosidase BglC (GH1 family)
MALAITFLLLLLGSITTIGVASISPKRRFQTSLDLQLSPNPAPSSSSVAFVGRLVAESKPLPSGTIDLAYSSDAETWVNLLSTVTNSSGQFSLKGVPEGQGNLYVRALYQATAQYSGSMSVSSIFILPSPSSMAGVHMPLWDDSDSRYKAAYFDWLKSYGINSIMLDFGWNKLEPTKGVYDQNYLGKMDRFLQQAKARDIHVVLRMHKWSYPIAYQSQSPNNAWILGFPAWLDDTPDFWENVENCWNSYVAMWTMLAARYKNESHVAGFDLLGEPGNDIGPGIYDAPGQGWLTWDCNGGRKAMGVLFDNDKLYEKTINAIHSVSNKLVVIEAFALEFSYVKTPGTQRAAAQRPNSENFAIGQSVYEWGGYEYEALDSNQAVADLWNVPFLATEFGVQVPMIDYPEPQKIAWVEQASQAFAARNMGWFYWLFSPGPNGDYNLVDERDDSVSPILSNTLSSWAKTLQNKTRTPILVASVMHAEMSQGLWVHGDTWLPSNKLETSAPRDYWEFTIAAFESVYLRAIQNHARAT